MTKTSNRPACSELIYSYMYYDAFYAGAAPAFQMLERQFPQDIATACAALPVPRTSTPQIEMPTDTMREPFHRNPSRDVDPEIKRQLDSELRDGTHPTTEALVPLGLRYLKILGAGTQGTAVLFEMDADDGTTRKIVVKYDTGEEGDYDGLSEEKEWMRVSESVDDMQYIVALLNPYCIIDEVSSDG